MSTAPKSSIQDHIEMTIANVDVIVDRHYLRLAKHAWWMWMLSKRRHEVWSWGQSETGGLGRGATEPQALVPKRTRELPRTVLDLAVGPWHTLEATGSSAIGMEQTKREKWIEAQARRAQNSRYATPGLYLCGEAVPGVDAGAQLAAMPPGSVLAPLASKLLVTSVATGSMGSCSYIVTARGALYAWGTNRHGCLGLGDHRDRAEPCLVAVLNVERKRVLQVEAGTYFAVALVEEGDGRDPTGGKGAAKAAAEAAAAAAAERGEDDAAIAAAAAAAAESAAAAPQKCFGAVTQRAVFAWGLVRHGRLGLGDDAHGRVTGAAQPDVPSPRRLRFFDAIKDEFVVRSVHCGQEHAAAIVAKRTVEQQEALALSRSKAGKKKGGSSSMLARRKLEAAAAAALAAGLSAAVSECEIVAEGGVASVFTWGNNAKGQLGHGDTRIRREPTLVAALEEDDIGLLALGGFHNIACGGATGRIWVWGEGKYGQLGLGHVWDETEPAQITGCELRGQEVISVAAGARHCAAVSIPLGGGRSGMREVWAWGYGSSGENGVGDRGMLALPRRVNGMLSRRTRSVHSGPGAQVTFAVTIEESKVWERYARGKVKQANRADAKGAGTNVTENFSQRAVYRRAAPIRKRMEAAMAALQRHGS